MQTEDVTTKSKHPEYFSFIVDHQNACHGHFWKMCATDPAPHLILQTRNVICLGHPRRKKGFP